MSRVAEECQTVIDPGREHIHVQELPCLETLRLGFVQERNERGIKILVHLKQFDLVCLGTPTWLFCQSLRRVCFEQKPLTTRLIHITLLSGMDAHEVELSVCIARIHNDAAVLTIPNDQLAVPLRVLCRQGVVQRDLAWDQEPKGALPRRSRANVSSRDLGASLGLQSGVSVDRTPDLKAWMHSHGRRRHRAGHAPVHAPRSPEWQWQTKGPRR